MFKIAKAARPAIFGAVQIYHIGIKSCQNPKYTNFGSNNISRWKLEILEKIRNFGTWIYYTIAKCLTFLMIYRPLFGAERQMSPFFNFNLSCHFRWNSLYLGHFQARREACRSGDVNLYKGLNQAIIRQAFTPKRNHTRLFFYKKFVYKKLGLTRPNF